MMYSRLRNIFPSAMLFLFAIACALPGVISETLPTIDPHALPTMIAGTAAAAASQTRTALPPTQSPTPIPTATLFPTATPTPVFSTEGTALLLNPDGTTTFIDQQGGYQLKVPQGWLLVRVDQQEFLDAWTLPEASDPKVQNFLHQVQISDPQLFRLFGVDMLPEHYQSGFVNNFNVFWDRNSTGSLGEILETLQSKLSQTSLNASITRAGVYFTPARIPVGVIESTSRLLTAEGWPINLYQKQAVFHGRTGALTIALSTTEELKNIYLSDFNIMVDQFSLR